MPERFLSSEEYDEQAHRLYNDGDYDGALEMLKEGLSLYPPPTILRKPMYCNAPTAVKTPKKKSRVSNSTCSM